MTTIDLNAACCTRRTPFEELVLSAAAAASAFVSRRVARRETRVARVLGDGLVEAERSASAGAHAHGFLPR